MEQHFPLRLSVFVMRCFLLQVKNVLRDGQIQKEDAMVVLMFKKPPEASGANHRSQSTYTDLRFLVDGFLPGLLSTS